MQIAGSILIPTAGRQLGWRPMNASSPSRRIGLMSWKPEKVIGVYEQADEVIE